MRLAIVSHKLCWKIPDGGFSTDGGFPLQIKAISELFDETSVVVPCEMNKTEYGISPLTGRGLKVKPLSIPKGKGLPRKLGIPFWLIKNGAVIWREIKRADAVHAPVPGDVGTIGMLFALVQRKPLFVRHCGNWQVQRTRAEKFWRWSMERFAGGRNVMLATGGAKVSPSGRNPAIKWIFSTSLTETQIETSMPQKLPADGKIRLIIACRQEERKGTSVVIESLPLILRKFPNAVLDVVGSGALLGVLCRQAKQLSLTDKITFHGKVEHSRVVELLKEAHVFCFPTTASEGFPKAVLEALACGLPVITTKVSVLPELIGDGAGILIDEATAKNVGQAVEKICRSPQEYAQMSAAAIIIAREFSLEKWRETIGDHLRRAWNVDSLSECVETPQISENLPKIETFKNKYSRI